MNNNVESGTWFYQSCPKGKSDTLSQHSEQHCGGENKVSEMNFSLSAFYVNKHHIEIITNEVLGDKKELITQ